CAAAARGTGAAKGGPGGGAGGGGGGGRGGARGAPRGGGGGGRAARGARPFKLRAARIPMRRMQSPRPPIWMAANSDGGVRRAARLGDAWLMNPHATMATLERQVELFRSTRRELGRPAAIETPLIKECYVAPDAATALPEAAPSPGPNER